MHEFATGDVTESLTTLAAHLNHQPDAPDQPALARRDPTAAELTAAATALRGTGRFIAPGATLKDAPATTAAFPGAQPLYVALPQQPAGQPLVHFGPALAKEFPGRPIVAMYGQWVEYDGPFASDFSDVATASFYGQFADRLSTYAYPQRNVLGAWLDRVTAIRYAGLSTARSPTPRSTRCGSPCPCCRGCSPPARSGSSCSRPTGWSGRTVPPGPACRPAWPA